MSAGHSSFSLYDVSLEGVQIRDILEANEGELTPELEERLDHLMQEGPASIEAAAVVVQNLLASALVCEQESLRLKARADSFTGNANRLKERMAIALDCAFGGKVKTNRFTMWTQKAADSVAFDLLENVGVDEIEKQAPDLVRVKKELNKIALKELYERGEELPRGVYVDKREGRRYARIK